MNPERAQMLREIRREYCNGCSKYSICLVGSELCSGFEFYLEDLFAEAESQTEPENENGTV